jgi:prolyl 4-hydroxylase
MDSEICTSHLPAGCVVTRLHATFPIFQIDNFLQDGEANAIRRTAGDRLQPSQVGDVETGTVDYDTKRTSTSLALEPHEFLELQTRVAGLVRRNHTHLENICVVRYTKGQKFDPHLDAYSEAQMKCFWGNNGGQLLATCFCFLNDMPEGAGGETDFPLIGVRARPHKNRAMIWLNCDADGKILKDSLHAGLQPLSDTVKWGCNFLVHLQPTPKFFHLPTAAQIISAEIPVPEELKPASLA